MSLYALWYVLGYDVSSYWDNEEENIATSETIRQRHELLKEIKKLNNIEKIESNIVKKEIKEDSNELNNYINDVLKYK